MAKYFSKLSNQQIRQALKWRGKVFASARQEAHEELQHRINKGLARKTYKKRQHTSWFGKY